MRYARRNATAEQRPKERLLKVKELAEALQVSPWAIYQKTASGEIPVVRIGSAQRYVLAEVIKALREGGRD